MGTQAPPDGWQVTQGVWGADAVQASSAGGAGGVGVGGIKLGANGAATTVVSDWIPLDTSTIATVGYIASAYFQYSAFPAHSGNVTVNFCQYDITRTTKVTQQVFQNVGTITSTDVSIFYASAKFASSNTKPWGRWEITTDGKPVFFYRTQLDRARPSLIAGLSGNQSFGATTWTTINTWQTTPPAYDLVMSGNGVAVFKAGLYSFNGIVSCNGVSTGVPAGSYFTLRLQDGTGATYGLANYFAPGAGSYVAMPFTFPVDVQKTSNSLGVYTTPIFYLQVYFSASISGGVQTLAGQTFLTVSPLT